MSFSTTTNDGLYHNLGVYAYACPQDYTWTKPNGTIVVNPFPNEDTATNLIDRCKIRLKSIEAMLAKMPDLEIEAETLRKMIEASEKK